MNDSLSDNTWLDSLIAKAIDHAGASTIFAAITAAGIGYLTTGAESAIWLAMTVFGIAGILEVQYRKAHTQLAQSREKGRLALENDPFFRAELDHPDWHPVVLKKFDYAGLEWRAFGFKEIQIPLAITAPHCPRCQVKLTQRSFVAFPGRAVSRFHCDSCGFKKSFNMPADAIVEEAERFAGLPIDASTPVRN